MPKLNFFIPITYAATSKSIGSSLLEKVDSYFYLGEKKAHVIQGRTKIGQEKVILSESRSSLLARAGKVLSYFTIVIPLLMLIAKAVLRSTHSYKLIDQKQKLEKGMDISEQTAAKIQGLMPKILGGQRDDELEWLSTGNNLVFKLAQHPQFVFKFARPNGFHGKDKLPIGNDKTDSRFENMVKAKEVCVVNELGLLIIPHAKKFTVNADGNDYAFIVEESLDFNPNESAHEELYHKYSTELNETARQLATFVAKTGFNDVTWRNVPILKEAQEFQGPRRIALIDLEHMDSTVNGFIGDFNGSRGLIRCLSEAQIDTVIAEARKQGVAITDEQARSAKKRRLQELESDKALRTLYEKNGIITGKEPIQVDLESLDLDLTEEGQVTVLAGVEEGKLKLEKQTVTLRKVTEDIIAEMNRLIQDSSDQASTKGKRYFVLNTNEYPFKAYDNLGLPSVKAFINEEEEKQLWLRRIVAALVDKGHILKLDKVNGNSYFIQA
jgi:hypothetical protein